MRQQSFWFWSSDRNRSLVAEEKGQGLTEYVLLTFLLVVVVAFVPVHQGMTLGELFANAINIYMKRIIYFVGFPAP